MKIEEQFTIAASPEIVYAEINDVSRIGGCIAGVQHVDVINDDESHWNIEVRAGFVAMSIYLDARIVERRLNDLLRFEASGQDVDIDGHVALVPDGAGTACSVTINAVIGGALGPLADKIARGPQEQLIAETVENIRARLETTEAPADGAGIGMAAASGAYSDAAHDGSGSRRNGSGLRVQSARPRPSINIALPGEQAGVLIAGGVLVLTGYLIGRSKR